MAIAFFYAVGTAIGGITGPLLFGRLIENGVTATFWGYVLGASLMIAAGVVELFLGVEAAQQNLENIAKPLTAQDAEEGEVVGERLDEAGENRPFEARDEEPEPRFTRDTEVRSDS